MRALPRLRYWWHRYVRRYRYEICRACGRPVGLVWTTEDALWNDVVGGPHGIRCIPCFDAELEHRGLFVRWVPKVEHD